MAGRDQRRRQSSRRDFLIVQKVPQRLRVGKRTRLVHQRFYPRRQTCRAVAMGHHQFLVTPLQARFQLQIV